MNMKLNIINGLIIH